MEMENQNLDPLTETIVETLVTRGWCFGDRRQVRAVVYLHSALSYDRDVAKVADSAESELLNTDLRTIGGKSLPDPNRKTNLLHGPKVLQVFTLLSSFLCVYVFHFS